MEITFLGHAGLHIKTKTHQFIVDPFISGNPSASHISLASLKADYILITHAHQDHILDVEEIAGHNPNAKLISNYEVMQWFGAKGLEGHPLNHGGKIVLDFGTVKYMNAIHSSIFPDGTYGGNPGGFVLTTNEKTIYIAGDTALTLDMKLIPMSCPKLDLAILPIGDNFTMGYEDAAMASDFVECDTILGYHYDTFPPIVLDKTMAQNYFETRNKKLLLPKIGETIKL